MAQKNLPEPPPSKQSPPNRQKQGRLGETLAKEYLLSKKYTLLGQNFQLKFGEIDLIFKDHDTVVFVEVKARKSSRFGMPEEAITPRKLQTISKVGEYYLVSHGLDNHQARIDAVAVELNKNPPAIRHHINVTG